MARLRRTAWSTLALVLALLVGGSPAAAVDDPGAPALTAVEWLPRGGTSTDPVLNLRLTIEAPAGLSGGEVRLGSVHHEILASVALGPLDAGTHPVHVEAVPPGDKPRPWELIGLTLEGSDGQTRDYGFCDLATTLETRERGGDPRLSVVCLERPSWVVYTVRAGSSPSATLWRKGVATRNQTYVGSGHVMQDASGAIETWGTSLSVLYPRATDGTYLRVGDTTVVDEPAPDPSEEPDTRRIVSGVGGSTPSTMVPGQVYRWGTYLAYRAGHVDLPYVSLEGTGLEVLDVEVGGEVGIAWGRDFDHSLVVQRSAADLAVAADGDVTRSFARTTTAMFGFVGGRSAGLLGANVGRVEGPSAGPVGTVVVAGQPGDYRFVAHAGVGQSWGQHAVAYADMPLTAQAPA